MNIGTRVKRNPAPFPAHHPGLALRGTIIKRQGTGFLVKWDGYSDDEAMPYLKQELVPVRKESF